MPGAVGHVPPQSREGIGDRPLGSSTGSGSSQHWRQISLVLKKSCRHPLLCLVLVIFCQVIGRRLGMPPMITRREMQIHTSDCVHIMAESNRGSYHGSCVPTSAASTYGHCSRNSLVRCVHLLPACMLSGRQGSRPGAHPRANGHADSPSDRRPLYQADQVPHAGPHAARVLRQWLPHTLLHRQ